MGLKDMKRNHDESFQDNDSMMTLKEIFGKTSTIGPMEVNEALKIFTSHLFTHLPSELPNCGEAAGAQR